MSQKLTRLVANVLLLISLVNGFYISFAPKEYQKGEDVEVFVNKIVSDKTQLPFAYRELPFACGFDKKSKSELLNLGEVLKGDRPTLSNYKIKFLEPTSCQTLCTTNELSASTIKVLTDRIQEGYRAEFLIDDMPSVRRLKAATPAEGQDSDKERRRYLIGYELGPRLVDNEGKPSKNGDVYFHNHLAMNILYEKTQLPAGPAYFILGFEVYPKSIKWPENKCDANLLAADKTPEMLKVTKDLKKITYTYSVSWTEETSVHWFDRWNLILNSQGPENSGLHWYSILNSMIILLFLSAMVAVIMLRTLHRDIASYNDQEMNDDDEGYGWKVLHADVFRPPKWGGLLAPLVGTGVQILLSVMLITAFAMFGVLNPSYRGGIVHVSLFLFMFLGSIGGYVSSRLYITFKGTSWTKNAFWTTVLCPTIATLLIFINNTVYWAFGSSNAIPFGSFFALAAMWFFINTPLVFIGAWFGFRKKGIEHPVRTNQIPRQIPTHVNWYLRPWASIFLAGLVPFAVEFLEFNFVLDSIWKTSNFYYMFGFLGLCVALVLISIVEITIVTIYFQLGAENYRWHWRSFLIGSASSYYIFGYSIFYLSRQLHITEPASGIIFVVGSLIGCFVYWLFTGAVGFISSYLFLVKLYGAIKVD